MRKHKLLAQQRNKLTMRQNLQFQHQQHILLSKLHSMQGIEDLWQHRNQLRMLINMLHKRLQLQETDKNRLLPQLLGILRMLKLIKGL